MDELITPILIKQRPDMGWAEDERVFYVLSRDGLFICRNHEFFQSCAKARSFPAELERHEPFLIPHYPRLSRQQFELIVGFFAEVGDAHGAEAAVLLAWDRQEERVRIIVPEQVATVNRNWWGQPYPIGLNYSFPTDLPAHVCIFGDVHSHVDLPAYASSVDVHDEHHQAGLHIVVGRIDREPPDFHVEAVVDGERFRLDLSTVTDGYDRRRIDVPQEWVDRVRVEEDSYYNKKSGSGGGYYGTSSGYSSSSSSNSDYWRSGGGTQGGSSGSYSTGSYGTGGRGAGTYGSSTYSSGSSAPLSRASDPDLSSSAPSNRVTAASPVSDEAESAKVTCLPLPPNGTAVHAPGSADSDLHGNDETTDPGRKDEIGDDSTDEAPDRQ